MHGNARLTPVGRLTMVLRIEAGRPVADVAAEMGISRPTAYKWWHRWSEEGESGLVDRSSRPDRCPHQTSPAVAAQIEELRCTLKLGPARIGHRLGVPASTVQRVLVRLGLNRLAWMDRPTGGVIRRYERDRPGDLVHVDIKKLGRIPDGGGWKVLGKQAGIKNNSGHGPGRSATATSTPRSMTTAVSPTPRSSATNARRPRRGSGPGPDRGSPITGSRSVRSSPTTAAATAAGSSLMHWARSSTASPGPTGHRPTARSNASTAPCSRSGLTSGPTTPKRKEQPPSAASSISTITTAATAPSAVSHPSPASTTYRVTTTSSTSAATPLGRWSPRGCRPG